MNVFEQYAWYAKVEVTTSIADPNESKRVMSDFLQTALPQIERCLPPMQSPREGASTRIGPAQGAGD